MDEQQVQEIQVFDAVDWRASKAIPVVRVGASCQKRLGGLDTLDLIVLTKV